MYIVEKERLLGYTIGEQSDNKPVSMLVMVADVEQGGDPLLINRVTLAVDYRKATKEDEERFKVRLT